MTRMVSSVICPSVQRLLLVLLRRFFFYFLTRNFVSSYSITFLLYFFSYFLTTHVTVSKLRTFLDSDSVGYSPILTDNQKTNPVNPLNPELNPICYLLALVDTIKFVL